MNKEEARKFLIDISCALGNMSVEYLTEKDGEKMREAIKALEQEPCENCISREMAIKHLTKSRLIGDSRPMAEIFADLPSVQPKPKTGHLILLDECSNSGYYCSKCRKKIVKEGWSDTVKKINYCLNCGAKMVEPQESEE